MKKVITTLALAITAMSAQAEITGNAGLVSDYRFRGISQTQGGAALQGGVDYAHKSGFYIGNWNSSVSSDIYTNGAGLESDIYGGYKAKFGGVTLDVGALSYKYSGAKAFNTDEVYAGAGIGPVSAKVSHTYSSKYFNTANAKGTKYYEVNFAQAISKVTVVAHAGRTDVANQTNGDYNDYNAGVVVAVGGFDLGAKYYVNNEMNSTFKTSNTVNGEKNYDKGFVLSVTKAF